MKNIFSVGLFLLFIFSCSKTNDRTHEILKVDTSHCLAIAELPVCSGILCQSDTCQNYYTIWEDQFLLKNQMTREYFDEHITPCTTHIHNWVDGISFEISYKVKIDWAEAVLSDKFAIWLSKTTLGLFPSLNLPRNVLLTGDQINSLFSLQAFSSSINSVSSSDQLKYSSLNEAMDALIKAVNVDTLCTGDVFFQSPNPVLPPVGDPYIEASGALNWNENKCITATLDLATGEAEIFYNACINTPL